MTISTRIILSFSSLCLCVSVVSSSARGAGKLEYNRDVRPILAESCFACHGPDSAARKAGLRLDHRDEAIKAEAIAPGHPEKSALVERIFAHAASEQMPPRKSGKKLTAAQKETRRRWIAEGATVRVACKLMASGVWPMAGLVLGSTMVMVTVPVLLVTVPSLCV
jgi:hypothetical protein